MKKRILSIFVLVAFLFSKNISMTKLETKQFNGYDIVNGIIMDQEAREKIKNPVKKLDSQQSLDDFLNQNKSSESDREYRLYKEKSKKMKEEESYSDRFIVKYKKTINGNNAQLEKAVGKALKQAKKQKSKKESKWRESLKNIDSDRLNHLETIRNQLDERKNKDSEVLVKKMSKEKVNHKVIELDESIDPEVFSEQIIQEMGSEIEYIQPDYKMELSGIASGSAVEQEEKSTNKKKETNLKKTLFNRKLDLKGAWEVSKGEGVIVALIDTGVDIYHPMLTDQMIDGYDFYNDRKQVYRPDLGMEQAHGTHIAGIIAQSAPKVKIMPLKVFENGKAYTSDIIEAIDYAEANGSTIVNMSFGNTEENQALRETMEQSNMFFVCATGNNRTNLDITPVYPASFDLENIISVAALNQDLGMSYFSNYGNKNADVSAWGRDVYSALPDGEYGKMNGTSMSAGYVSGAAALVLANNEIKNLKKILKNTSDKLSCLGGKVSGGNKVNFTNAVNGFVNTEVIKVTPKEDFDVLKSKPASDENWELFSSSPNIQVEGGECFSMALKEDGTVWTWGYNACGQLGDGTNIIRYTPVQVIGLTNIKAISAGSEFGMALKEDGTVWSWGNNASGQLGDGTTTNRYTPVKVLVTNDSYKVKAISSAGSNSMEVKEDGTVWTWGYNSSGQLGDGTEKSSTIPVKVTGLSNVKAVSSGSDYSMAIKEDGTAWSWGSNSKGELGDGTTTRRKTPVQIKNLSKVTVISSGLNSYSMAIKEDGTVWSWGLGPLGNGNHEGSITPVQVNGLSGIVSVSSGYTHKMALKSDGSVWAWGLNGQYGYGNGTVGDGTTYTERLTPIKLNGISSITAIATGMHHTVALDKNGDVWSWGQYFYTQPDGSFEVTKASPFKIIFSKNTSFDTALTMNIAESQSGSIATKGEYLYYKFTPTVTTNYTIQSISNFDTYGYLYNASKQIIHYNDDGGSTGESSNNYDFYMKYKLTAGETYYIAIKAYSSSVTGNYVLKVGYWDDYDNEIYKSFDMTSSKLVNGVIDYPGDKDMFKFIPSVTGNYAIQSISNFDTYGYLYNSSGSQISYNDDGYGAGESSNIRDFNMKYKLTAGVTYYIAVKAYSSSVMGEYSLKVGYWDDYGNSIDKAFDMTGKDSINGEIDYPNESDVFKFIPATTGNYTIQTISSLDMYGNLKNSSGGNIAYSNDGGGAGESSNNLDFYIKYKLTAGVTYYISVNANPASAMGAYSLKIGFADDYGNTMDKAYSVVGKIIARNGEIDYPGDVDMIKYVPTTTADYSIQSMSKFDTYGYLYDSSGNQITYNDDSHAVGISDNIRDFYMEYKLIAGNTYYIAVKAYLANVIGDYAVRIEKIYQTTVNNYYDQAFNIRYSNGEDRAVKINEVNSVAKRIFKAVLNLNITNNTPVMITSTADNCKIKRGVGINSITIDQRCPLGTNHTPECTGRTKSYEDFIANYPGNDTKVSVLWTGNKLWDSNRSFTWYNNGITIQELGSNDRNYYEEITPCFVHELAHQCGAPDHYHEISSDGSCTGGSLCITCNPSTGRQESCLMNTVWGVDLKTSNKNTVFCEGCTNDMKTHMQSHH